VPVVQAWEWGEEIGEISLHLDDSGRTIGWDASPFLPLSDTILRDGRRLGEDSSLAVRTRLVATGAARFFAPDPEVQAMLSAWAGPIEALRRTVVARIPLALRRDDPALAALCARALREAAIHWGAQVGLQNGGGVREGLPAGDATSETVRRIMPFQNTVVVVALRGAELRALRESLASRMGAPAGWDGIVEGSDGSLRLVATGRPLGDSDTVRIATNSYLASGKDGCRALARSDGFRQDTGIEDAQALSALLARTFPPIDPKGTR
jgi:5'-nucleotidase / UDP-sugar diphosphatase